MATTVSLAAWRSISTTTPLFCSGKIDLAGLETPALSFFTYNITSGSDVDENELEINIVCEGKTENVENIRIADLGAEEGWYRVIVPLDAFKGKAIQPLITAYGRIFLLYPHRRYPCG